MNERENIADVPESLDERIARLKRQCSDAEIDKVSEQLGSVAGEFINILSEFWQVPQPYPTMEMLRAALGFCSEAWAKFEAWRAANATKEDQRPYLALPAVPRALLPSGRSPAGAGSVYASGNGFRWRLSRNGALIGSRTWPTREEAEAELALAVADPAFVPAPKDRKRLGETGRKHCSRCGSADHRAPRCQATTSESDSPDSCLATGAAGGKARAAALSAQGRTAIAVKAANARWAKRAEVAHGTEGAA